MNVRLCTAFAVAGIIACLASGCSSSSSSTTASLDERTGDAAALIVQCALTSGLMKPPTGLSIPSGQTAFINGTKLTLTSMNADAFNSWYNGIARTKVAGEYLEDWVQGTATSGKLPAAVCGTSTTTSELQKQVFAGDASVSDPW
jgi:hypothetical protein